MNWVLTSYNLARIDGEADGVRDLINAASAVVAKSPDAYADPNEVLGELQKAKPEQQQNAYLKQQAEFATELYKAQRTAKPGGAKPK